MQPATRPAGTVAALYRYPVKSMAGEELAETHLWWPGLDGDRRWAFVRSGSLSPFPWLTGRVAPAMIRYAPYFVDPANPMDSPVRVRTPAGADLALDAPELARDLAAQHGAPVHLLHLGTGTFDSIGVSLLSTATLAGLGRALAAPLDVRRFRPNILVTPADPTPYAEDGWLGGVLTFGAGPDAAQIRVSTQIERCMMVNLDPATATQDPAVLRAVAQEHAACASVGCVVVRPGRIRRGDPIHLTPAS
jgi:uncharacterized protein